MKKTLAEKITSSFIKAREKQIKDYEWAFMSARNPYEYGYKSEEELLIEILAKFKISRK